MEHITHPATGFAVGNPYKNPLAQLPTSKQVAEFTAGLILSPSGWRGVFAGHDEDISEPISPAAHYVVARMARTFADFLKKESGKHKPVLALGIDTRPTGPAIAETMIRIFLACGIDVRYAFICAAPEIMAWTSQSNAAGQNQGTDWFNTGLDGFCYVSASHNPVGHNGVKFGLKDGGVLSPQQSNLLLASLKEGMGTPEDIASLQALSGSISPSACGRIFAECSQNKRLALSAYTLFSRRVMAAENTVPVALGSAVQPPAVPPAAVLPQAVQPVAVLPAEQAGHAELKAEEASLDAVASAIRQHGIGIIVDMNGSARSLSIDLDFFSGLGADIQAINERPRQFAHRIVPEGESLEQCRRALEAAHQADDRYVMGYVPDCDGDRGNIVIWDDGIGAARSLEAQETFALAVLAELACLEHKRLLADHPPEKLAVVGNDATSLRADTIAAAFGASMQRAETGEANVVALARHLRDSGQTVRILGEGSNGGVITHPASVRDPLNTIGALLKLLALRGTEDAPGPYQLWLERSSQARLYSPDYSLADIVASLPAAVSTSVFESRAALKVQTKNPLAIKERSRLKFAENWPEIMALFAAQFGPVEYNTLVSRGTAEFCIQPDQDCGAGGLKFLIKNKREKAVGFFWMRGSATEPVFRIMVDVAAARPDLEERLLGILTNIVRSADACST